MSQIPATRLAIWFGLFVIVASLYAACPRFTYWVFRPPDSVETFRAAQFIQQCDSPATAQIDAAMRLRLLPPYLCRMLGLYGYATMLVPWAGVMLALGSLLASLYSARAVLGFRHLGSRAHWVVIATILGNLDLPVAHYCSGRIISLCSAPTYFGWW